MCSNLVSRVLCTTYQSPVERQKCSTTSQLHTQLDPFASQLTRSTFITNDQEWPAGIVHISGQSTVSVNMCDRDFTLYIFLLLYFILHDHDVTMTHLLCVSVSGRPRCPEGVLWAWCCPAPGCGSCPGASSGPHAAAPPPAAGTPGQCPDWTDGPAERWRKCLLV